MKNDIKTIVEKIYKREVKKFKVEQKKCVKHAYDFEREKWNEEHFNHCEGDVIAGKLDILEEIKKDLKI